MKEPDLDNSSFAEFIGVLLGDGSIGKYKCKTDKGYKNEQYCVKVTLSSEEKHYGNYIEDKFSELFGLEISGKERKSENVYDIRCFKKELFNFLTKEIGLKTSPKWESAKIPDYYLDTELEKEVLRGYFDTDGSVVLTDNNGMLYPRLETKICPSPMQEQFIEILERNNFNFGAYDIGKGKIRVQMNGKKQLRRFINKIGFKNRKHISKAGKVVETGN